MLRNPKIIMSKNNEPCILNIPSIPVKSTSYFTNLTVKMSPSFILYTRNAGKSILPIFLSGLQNPIGGRGLGFLVPFKRNFKYVF